MIDDDSTPGDGERSGRGGGGDGDDDDDGSRPSTSYWWGAPTTTLVGVLARGEGRSAGGAAGQDGSGAARSWLPASSPVLLRCGGAAVADEDDDIPTDPSSSTTTTATCRIATRLLLLSALALGALRSLPPVRRTTTYYAASSSSPDSLRHHPQRVFDSRSSSSGNSSSREYPAKGPWAAPPPAPGSQNRTGDARVDSGTLHDDDLGLGDDGDARPEANCSCLTVDAASSSAPGRASASTCCQRTILRAHKFGFRWAGQLFGHLRDAGELVLTGVIDPRYIPPSPSADYRHVVTIRNYFDAFVSGYLYHKSGRECWLSMEGEPYRRPVHVLSGWEGSVRDARPRYPRFGTYPPERNRSLCQYLADESERDGMKVYAAFAMEKWYSGLLAYLQTSKGPGSLKRRRDRTHFVCLEDASDLRRQEALYDAVMDHLYPGSTAQNLGGRYSRPFPLPPIDNATLASGEGSSYHGSHASNHDPDLRRRLLGIVRKLDRQVFGRQIAVVDELMGCGRKEKNTTRE